MDITSAGQKRKGFSRVENMNSIKTNLVMRIGQINNRWLLSYLSII